MDAAAARPDPIPVYAEMSSLNPVFVLPGYDGGVQAPADSMTGSSGQLCTKPGLVITSSPSFARSRHSRRGITDRMLTPGMAAAHASWRAQADGLGEIIAGTQDPAPFALITVQLHESLLEEHFGPSVVIYTGSVDPAPLQGSLTATILAGPSDMDTARELLPA